jgi:hypothetical protein
MTLHIPASMRVYEAVFIGDDGKTYGLRLIQTRKEMEQFLRVGIIKEINELHYMEETDEYVFTGVIQ